MMLWLQRLRAAKTKRGLLDKREDDLPLSPCGLVGKSRRDQDHLVDSTRARRGCDSEFGGRATAKASLQSPLVLATRTRCQSGVYVRPRQRRILPQEEEQISSARHPHHPRRRRRRRMPPIEKQRGERRQATAGSRSRSPFQATPSRRPLPRTTLPLRKCRGRARRARPDDGSRSTRAAARPRADPRGGSSPAWRPRERTTTAPRRADKRRSRGGP
jgi:hypothetical protein